MTAEHDRLDQARSRDAPWKAWGPYLSERQWGTVREDYSDSGDAWNYFNHDQARSRAYRWGEDGLAGISDDQQILCFALSLWNGNDPILKERLFGLTNSEGNHGEDVKEYYFYLDSTPTHSYMKYLYKYPQSAYPYADLAATNSRRGRQDFEYELMDTGVFDDDRYFDVFVEYAKASPEDILIQITAFNRGPASAALHLLPTLWFRNVWSWGEEALRPSLRQAAAAEDAGCVVAAVHRELGAWSLYCEGTAALLFTENDTNTERLSGMPNRTPFVKDGIDSTVVHRAEGAVNPEKRGTKAAAHYRFDVSAGESRTVRLRLRREAPEQAPSVEAAFGDAYSDTLNTRRKEADDFYATVIPASLDDDARNVMRQALAGMMWSKQFYYYDVDRWLTERGADPFNPQRRSPRNDHWHHMFNADIVSMPDKWEYPWYAAWDLAFHVLALTLVDPDFGKQQLDLMLRERYLHPNGQLPAYEWNFGDVNPPVHAWSTIFTYRLEEFRHGQGDLVWLERAFHKLLLNFTWWVNRKDREGNNVFEGGFLGLDNIGVFDRSAPLPTGGYLEQADGTAWMALFCENMLEIAAQLALQNPAYVDMCVKFVSHFLWIASSMLRAGQGTGMWDEEDGFFYDVLRLPDGRSERLKVRSMVGLLPLCAVTSFDGALVEREPEAFQNLKRFIDARPEIVASIHDLTAKGVGGRRLAAILNEDKLRRVLAKMLDENEFLSPYGIRSLSRHHADHPYTYRAGGQEYRVSYLPAESDTGMFGGNSNWRGPVWMPVNGLIIRALLQYFTFYGNDFKVECPTNSGHFMTLYEVAEEITNRLARIFLRGPDGRRPVYGGTRKFQDDPHWRDHILFYEYFHGDNGAGLGASHQTGWTGIVSRAMHMFATTTPEQLLKMGRVAAFAETPVAKPE
ncbi:Mannosyl oligosaccharide glucosidase [Caballeronia arationis]|uniref:MGH1-like glycoside hydrolase domain-containing protein n=1 Tax=Caballeronia arationis TaxID=1777142 RepID=UPI00074BEA2D|nr:glucosidase [Caballeronia arationis]SAK88316.1 Mannosyl oligosaccharide glucosidase [Caballeronia arationis]